MGAVAQEGQQRRRDRAGKGQLRNEIRKRGGRGGGGRNITVRQTLLLAKMAEVGGAHPVPGGGGRKVRHRGATGQQSQGEDTAQQNASGDGMIAAEMGTSHHEWVPLRWMIPGREWLSGGENFLESTVAGRGREATGVLVQYLLLPTAHDFKHF